VLIHVIRDQPVWLGGLCAGAPAGLCDPYLEITCWRSPSAITRSRPLLMSAYLARNLCGSWRSRVGRSEVCPRCERSDSRPTHDKARKSEDGDQVADRANSGKSRVRSILRGKCLALGRNSGKTLAIMNSGPVHPRLCGIKGIGDAFTVGSYLFGQRCEFLNKAILGLPPLGSTPRLLKC